MLRGTRKLAVAFGLALGGWMSHASAQLPPPPPPPTTLWSFLGIPQGYRYVRDNAFNRNGNRPGLERKPPIKAIAAVENLKSPDPAIKKAAEIKQAEDLKKQKIKAIKYLASIGCGCYNRDGSITDALLKSMDDCTEEVRLATVQSMSLAAAGERCANCKQKSCCSEELSNKLYEIAYEKDENGCWLEPSERVRLAAAEALRVCCPGGGDNIIYEVGPPAMPPATGAEQPSVLPETGAEQPAAPLPPVIPAPSPSPPLPLQGQPIPPGALPTDAPLPAPAPAPIVPPVPRAAPPAAAAPARSLDSSPGPRSSRRTAMLSTSQATQSITAAKKAGPLPTSPLQSADAPHWTMERSTASVSFPNQEPAAEPIAHDSISKSMVQVPARSEPQAAGGVPARLTSARRLPPVQTPTADSASVPLSPSDGAPALQVSSRRSARTATATPQEAPAAARPKVNQRSSAERNLPGEEFGVGTITSVRFKDGLAFVEFGGERAVPSGSILRAYHQFALTGSSAVCDLEVVDGQRGQTIAIARRGSEITSLMVGDTAIVLQ